MSGLNYYSDYGSGSSSNSSTTWPTQELWSNQTSFRQSRSNDQTSASFQDLVMGRCTLEDIMKEFHMNGSDSPYSPDDDRIWGNAGSGLAGLGPASAYVRQKSWPAPERSPAHRLPRAHSRFSPAEFTSTPSDEGSVSPPPAALAPALTTEQLQALYTLPNAALFALLQDLEQSREGYKRVKRLSSECRFCKNNGERECYYRSHSLKDGAGRVTCPVLRAFVCARCGASGDLAHTIKYCPLSTTDERLKSAAMLRSVRLASGRRRAAGSVGSGVADNGLLVGDTSPSVVSDTNSYNSYSSFPLDPLWAALEQKLLL